MPAYKTDRHCLHKYFSQNGPACLQRRLTEYILGPTVVSRLHDLLKETAVTPCTMSAMQAIWTYQTRDCHLDKIEDARNHHFLNDFLRKWSKVRTPFCDNWRYKCTPPLKKKMKGWSPKLYSICVNWRHRGKLSAKRTIEDIVGNCLQNAWFPPYVRQTVAPLCCKDWTITSSRSPVFTSSKESSPPSNRALQMPLSYHLSVPSSQLEYDFPTTHLTAPKFNPPYNIWWWKFPCRHCCCHNF